MPQNHFRRLSASPMFRATASLRANIGAVASSWIQTMVRCVAVLLMAGSTQASLAEDYPVRPIELVVPWAVGGGTDAVARAFADAAAKHLSKPIVVINRAGAAGAIGHQEGASAKADGYKMTMVTPEISLAYLQGIGK